MAEFLTNEDKRSCYCAEVNESMIGEKICVMGWVQRQRDLGALIFIDLRDRTGIVQLAFNVFFIGILPPAVKLKYGSICISFFSPSRINGELRCIPDIPA